MQDARHSNSTQSPVAHLFYSLGEDDLATFLADWLQTPQPTPYDALNQPNPAPLSVMLWRGPDHTLCSGTGVLRALSDWKQLARNLLTLHRQNRRTLILVEASGLRRGGLGPLADRLGLAAPHTHPDGPAPSPLGQALARLALDHDPDLRHLTDDLLAASLPCPDVDLADVMENLAAHSTATDHRLTVQQDELARQKAEAAAQLQMLGTQISLLHDAVTEQDHAEQTRTQTTALHIAALQGQIASQTADLSAQRTEADLLRTQIGLQTAAQSRELAAVQTDAETAAAAHALHRATSAAELALHRQTNATQQTEIARLTTTLTDMNAKLTAATADAGLLRGQLGLADTELARQVDAAQTLALRSAAAKGETALQSQSYAAQQAEITRLTTALTDLNAKLTDATADAGLLRSQLGLTDATALASQTDRADEAAMLRSQIDLLQDSLAQSLMAPPPDTPKPDAPGSLAWDQALAKALAAARSEADQRARLEKEVSTLRAAAQNQTRRSEDQAHNRKLFALMTKEAAAALDEIARLSQSGPTAKPPSFPDQAAPNP